MAHGPDTDELLRRLEESRNSHTLNVSQLQITSLPELPEGIQKLLCYNTHLTTLPELPAGLRELYCFNTPLTSLPELPGGLEHLDCKSTMLSVLPELPAGLTFLCCDNTQVIALPELPAGLLLLCCRNTQITTLPELPAGILHLCCENTSLLLQRKDGESIADYGERWRVWREEEASKKRCKERSETVKDEMVAAAWHPRRVEKWIEAGRWDLLD